MQKLAPVQLTPLRTLAWLVLVLGEPTRLQAVPFHFSVRVCCVPPLLTAKPTARPGPPPVELTPCMRLARLALVLGEPIRLQLLPFPFSMRVCWWLPALTA